MSKIIRFLCVTALTASIIIFPVAADGETQSAAESAEQSTESVKAETEPTFTLPRDQNSETADGILFATDPSSGEVTITGYTGYEKKLTVPSSILGGSVTAVAQSAFAQNATIEYIVLPDSVREIGESAFEGCTNLKNVTLPANLTAIPRCSFRNCERLTSVKLPETVTYIGDFAFENCARLGKLEIPEAVAEIGPDAFMGCSRLYFVTGSNELVREYAASYGISTSFTDTFAYRIVIIVCLTLVISAALLFIRHYYRKYMKKPS